MSDKALKNLVIVLVAVLAIYGIFRLIDSKSSKQSRPTGFDFASLDESSVDNISIKNASSSYQILINNRKWQIGKKDVGQAFLNQLWDSLKKAKVDEVVTDKKSKHSLFQVDDVAGKIVKFYSSGKQKAVFIFGKQNSNFSGGYVRKPGDNKVYLVYGPLSSIFDKTEKEWFSVKQTNETKK